MTDTLTIVVSMAGMLAVATGVILTVTITLLRMVGQRIDDLRADFRNVSPRAAAERRDQ